MSCREPGSKPKPWSTGRVLTEEQRRRKREVNQLSQRRRKNKIAQRVEHLETKLSNLLDGSASTSPTNTATEFPYDEPTPQKVGEVFRESLPNASCYRQNLLPAHSRTSDNFHLSSPLSRMQYLPQYYHMKIHDNYIDSYLRLTLPITPPVTAAFSKYRTSIRSEIITTSCQHLNKTIASLPISIICSNDLQNQNMLILTVLYGWSITETLPRLCPRWAILQHVDTSLFKEMSAIESFVLLRHIHMMMLVLLELGNCHFGTVAGQRNSFYDHHPSIDYLGWYVAHFLLATCHLLSTRPGLREPLVLSSALRMADHFWAMFRSCFRFEWPYTITACETGAATGMLPCIPLFDFESLDIDSCRITAQFIDAFPGMADDIPTASSEPLQIFGLDDHEEVENLGFSAIGRSVGEDTQLVSPSCSTFDNEALNAFVVHMLGGGWVGQATDAMKRFWQEAQEAWN